MRCGYQGFGDHCDRIPTVRVVNTRDSHRNDTSASCDEHLEWFESGKHPWGPYRPIPLVELDELPAGAQYARSALSYADGPLTARQVQRRVQSIASVHDAEQALDVLVGVGWAARVEDVEGQVAARYSAIEAPPVGVRCCPPGQVPLTEHPNALQVAGLAIEPVDAPDYFDTCGACNDKLRDVGGVKVTRRAFNGEPTFDRYCLRHFREALDLFNVRELLPWRSRGLPKYIVRKNPDHPWRLRDDIGHFMDWVKRGEEVRRIHVANAIEHNPNESYSDGQERYKARRRQLEEAADRFIRGDGIGLTLDFEERDDLLAIVAAKIQEFIRDDFLRRALIAEARVRDLEAQLAARSSTDG